jgi:hypothetical protein
MTAVFRTTGRVPGHTTQPDICPRCGGVRRTAKAVTPPATPPVATSPRDASGGVPPPPSLFSRIREGVRR